MKVVHTSIGPALEDDAGEVIMASDWEAIKKIAKDSPKAIAELVAAQLAEILKIQVVAADIEQEDVTLAEQGVLANAARCLDGMINVADAVRAAKEDA